jgi:hypothetical protein
VQNGKLDGYHGTMQEFRPGDLVTFHLFTIAKVMFAEPLCIEERDPGKEFRARLVRRPCGRFRARQIAMMIQRDPMSNEFLILANGCFGWISAHNLVKV